jgi:hypothetical protein
MKNLLHGRDLLLFIIGSHVVESLFVLLWRVVWIVLNHI